MRRLRLCWGLWGLLAGPVAAQAPPLLTPPPATTLTPERHCAGACSITLVLRGTLDPGIVDRVRAIVDAQADPVTTVRFDSRGGTIRPAVDLARYIRTQSLDTEIGPGERCLSACVYAFIGGVHRQVDPQGMLGVHAHQGLPGTADDNPLAAQQVVRELFLHFQRMGTSPVLGLGLLAVPPDRMCYVRPSCWPILGLTTDPVPYLANRAACEGGGSAWADGTQESEAQVPHPSFCSAIDPLTHGPMTPDRDPSVGGGALAQ